MALTAMRITLDPTGAIGIGLTDIGTTIEIVPSGLQSILVIVQATTIPIMVEGSNLLNFPRRRSG